MSKNYYESLENCKETIKRIVELAWDNTVNPNKDDFVSAAEYMEWAKAEHLLAGPPTKKEFQKEAVRRLLLSCNEKVLNAIQLVMIAGRNDAYKKTPYRNPENALDAFAENLPEEDKLMLNKNEQVEYILSKTDLKEYLCKGLFLCGVK